jgi:DNA-binding NtrC family response regulator
MSENERAPAKTAEAGLPTILVVASDLTLLKLVKMALQLEFACEVLSFERGRSALETARHVIPALVIIHFYLFDLYALELADRLHTMQGFESVPILLTHLPWAFWNVALRSYLTVLTLPFQLETFYAAVQTCLDRA